MIGVIMRACEKKYKVIHSRELKPSCEEMACFLESINDYSISQLKQLRRLSAVLAMLKKYTTNELFAISGHCDFLIRGKECNNE